MKLEDRRAAGVLVLATLALAFDYYHRRLGILAPPWDFFEWHITALFVGPALGWIASYGRTFLPAFLMHWIWDSALEVLVVVAS